MKLVAMPALLMLGLSSGCGGSPGLESPTAQGAPSDPSGPARSASPSNPTPAEPGNPTPAEPSNPTPVEPQSADVCATDGSFGFRVFGDGLAWEGQTVAAAAIENHSDFTVQPALQWERRPVRMATQIQGGSFSISCPSSLRENYGYPSYALYVDVNQDGRCSAGDVGATRHLYGWNRPIDDHIGVSPDWVEFVPIEQLYAPVHLSDSPFCDAYFPETH